MGRETLGLYTDSLFIKKSKHTFKAADADLLTQAHTFSIEKSCDGNSTGYRAANLLLNQSADAITIASALLAPLVWRNQADLSDIKEHLCLDIANTLTNIRESFFLQTSYYSDKISNIHAHLESMSGVPRKAILFITFRLLALEHAIEQYEPISRNMAQETLDFLVPNANRLSLGDLRRRLPVPEHLCLSGTRNLPQTHRTSSTHGADAHGG
jgi:GTP pyrophosphokinase